MDFLDGVMKKIQKLKDSDTEHQLFDDYCKARKQYLDAVRASVQGTVTPDAVNSFYRNEKEAFRKYLQHRIAFKGE